MKRARPRAGGRQRNHWEVEALTLALLTLAGCRTVAQPVPRPCDLLDDRPGLRSEVAQLKTLPGDPTKRLRWYALDADVSCAGNRALGAPPISKVPVVPWWKRWWGALWSWLP